MDPERLAALCCNLPVFPLPNAVLLPSTLLPLHVFEPRYRALVQTCLDTDRVMGVATLRSGGDPTVDPPMHPEVGVGEIVSHQALPDGRSNIVLQYIGRMTIEEEVQTNEPFRRVRGALGHEDPTGMDAAIQGLKLLVLQLGGVSPEAAEEARRLAALDGAELVDNLARRLLETSDDQRAYLATDRMVGRVAQVHDRLAHFLLATRAAGDA